MPSLRLPAFAKINTCLHIFGRRRDGYHELRTIYQTISLHDTLEFSLLHRPVIELECNDPALPTGRDNLVWRAAAAMRRRLRMRNGVRIRLEKDIPVERGLGGGSSDAAVSLLGVLRLARRKLPIEELLALAASLGSDVPFFLFGGRALGVGRGEEIYPLPAEPKRAVVVVSPAGVAVSTRQAYRWMSSGLTKNPLESTLKRFCALCWSEQGGPLRNDFERAVFQHHPRLARIKRALLRHGAAEAALAGSGSAVFGIFPTPAKARRAAQQFPNDQVFAVETLSRDEYRRALAG
jgi:4-diphosphocytidyl-2-C-methyl-D-erythritol kinase